ncbi:MAG TPA: hypothetical protein VGH37_05535 [Candidatus Acidoferrum sp.]|jgi:hypothetical protein
MKTESDKLTEKLQAEVDAEFLTLNCKRCGKSFEIAIAAAKRRNYSKRCETCRVSTTGRCDKPGRLKKEVCSAPGRVTSDDKKNCPPPKEISYEAIEIFEGIRVGLPAGLPAPAVDLVRSEAKALVSRIKPHLDLAEEQIKEAVARIMERKSVRELQYLFSGRKTKWVVGIIDTRKAGASEQAQEQQTRQQGLSDLLDSLQEAGRVSRDEVGYFVENRVNKVSLRDISPQAGVSKSQLGRMVNDVLVALHELGPSAEIASLLDNLDVTPVLVDVGLDEGYPVTEGPHPKWLAEVRETKDKFSKRIVKGPAHFFDRASRGDASDAPLHEDFGDESLP